MLDAKSKQLIRSCVYRLLAKLAERGYKPPLGTFIVATGDCRITLEIKQTSVRDFEKMMDN